MTNHQINASTKVDSDLVVVDPTYFSDGFPQEDWNKLISRSNYLADIDDAKSRGFRLIFIEGEEDAGKTTFLAQYVKRNPSNCISVFFNPLNSLDYHVDYFCANAVQQINWIISQDAGEESSSLISKEQYRQSLYHLRRYVRKTKNGIELVIDGLEDVVKESPDFLKELFDIMPFGEDKFTIIITGDKAKYLDVHQKLKREESTSILISGFGDGQALEYLGINSSSREKIGDLYKITKGFPGRLKTLKRLIENDDYSLDQITNHTNYKSWLELDCSSIDLNQLQTKGLMSLICISQYSYSIEDIAEICQLPLVDVATIINNISILQIKDKYVTIASPAHKKFLANLLRSNKQLVDDLLIEFYAHNETLKSLVELPKLYSEKREWGKVLELLNDQYFTKILDKTGSIQIVNDTIYLGVQAAENASKTGDLLKYCIQGSIVNELDNYLFWESEIEARISIQDFTGAMSLAESAILLVDRLRLLALVARRQKERFGKVEEILITMIKDLYQLIDISTVGKKIFDIVTHLIYAIPNLAIEIIEKSSDKVNDKNINSWIMTKLSFAAIDSSSKEDKSINSKKLEAIQNLNPPTFNKINQAISFLVGNYSAEKVLEEVNKITESEEKLKLLRLWLANRKSEIAHVEIVIDAALNELISSTSETSITISIITELTSQLPYVKDKKAKELLFKRFRNVQHDLLDLGLAKDRFVYELNMFHTQYHIDKTRAVPALNKIISEIDLVQDDLTKLESYAETLAKLTTVGSIELKKQISFVYAKIISLAEKLFLSTAFHSKISEDLLKVTGRRNPKLGLIIVEKINNQISREVSRLVIVDAYLDNNLKQVSTDVLTDIEKSFELEANRKKFYMSVLERFSEAKSLHFNTILRLKDYYNKLASFDDIQERLKGYTLFYKIVRTDEVWKKRLSVEIEKNIYNSWRSIESDWERIDEGFTVCYELSQHNPEFSKKIFEESECLKKESWLDSRLVAYTYLNSVILAIRGYNGLLCSSTETDDDLRVLQDLIARVPSQTERLNLWCQIGFAAFLADREKVFKKVMDDHILIIIHELVTTKLNLEQSLTVFTLVHIFDPELANKYIHRLAPNMKEFVLDRTCYFYLTKRNPYDLYEQNLYKYNATFSDISKAISLLKNIRSDVNIYYLIAHISKAILANRDLSKTQISSLTTDIQEIIDSNLPDKKNIKHDGYKIIAKLQLAKAGKFTQKSSSDWEALIADASGVPNLSDAILVKSILLADLPFEKVTNGQQAKRKLFDEVTMSLKQLPAHFEFVQRVIDISEHMYQCDPTTWKKYVEEAFDLSGQLKDGSEVYSSQKSIIDSMYRLDPAFAKNLIKRVDQENQSNKISKLVNKHYESLEVAEKIKNSKSLIQKEKDNAYSVVKSIQIALRSLNSDKITPRKLSEASRYLNVCKTLPLHENFPIYLFYMNNCAKMYRTGDIKVITAIHKDNFREAVNATNLIQVLSKRKKNSEKTYRRFFLDDQLSTNKAVKPKSREESFNFIKDWMLENLDEYLIVADPYLESNDVELLKIIKETGKDINVQMLGCKDYDLNDSETSYNLRWTEISGQEAPFVNITFCKLKGTNEYPFHDRWIITKNGGLRIGTSVNSVGHRRESEISVMTPSEALKIEQDTLNDYISRQKRELNNEKIMYKSFTL